VDWRYINILSLLLLLWPRTVLKTEGTVYPKTDLPRPANNVFIFSVGNYFTRNICVDFLLKQFHTVRVRLKYVFFVWIIKFTFAMIAVIIRIHNCLIFCTMFKFHVDFQRYKKLLK